MIKQNNKSIETETGQHKTDKKSLFIGGFVVLLIAASPFVFYLYKSFPEVKIWETSFFSLNTDFFSWFDFAWYIVNKFVPLYLLLLWFFTCRHWWYWILLVPIAMYAFQLWGVINQSKGLDEIEMIYIFPLMAFLVPFVYLIRAKLFSKLRGSKEFEAELAKDKTVGQQIMDLFR
ncbi:hypothetical protein [Patiriisocius sp. Uisw_017]|jgi:hypothetical protein|uniref:hypothetical protein n=1 Tax=Patiriisocius sp. Uisw_017 TaxID=3230968 RepID=UPI0039EAD4A9